jgi:hypothetical protein
LNEVDKAKSDVANIPVEHDNDVELANRQFAKELNDLMSNNNSKIKDYFPKLSQYGGEADNPKEIRHAYEFLSVRDLLTSIAARKKVLNVDALDDYNDREQLEVVNREIARIEHGNTYDPYARNRLPENSILPEETPGVAITDVALVKVGVHTDEFGYKDLQRLYNLRNSQVAKINSNDKNHNKVTIGDNNTILELEEIEKGSEEYAITDQTQVNQDNRARAIHDPHSFQEYDYDRKRAAQRAAQAYRRVETERGFRPIEEKIPQTLNTELAPVRFDYDKNRRPLRPKLKDEMIYSVEYDPDTTVFPQKQVQPKTPRIPTNNPPSNINPNAPIVLKGAPKNAEPPTSTVNQVVNADGTISNDIVKTRTETTHRTETVVNTGDPNFISSENQAQYGAIDLTDPANAHLKTQNLKIAQYGNRELTDEFGNFNSEHVLNHFADVNTFGQEADDINQKGKYDDITHHKINGHGYIPPILHGATRPDGTKGTGIFETNLDADGNVIDPNFTPKLIVPEHVSLTKKNPINRIGIDPAATANYPHHNPNESSADVFPDFHVIDNSRLRVDALDTVNEDPGKLHLQKVAPHLIQYTLNTFDDGHLETSNFSHEDQLRAQYNKIVNARMMAELTSKSVQNITDDEHRLNYLAAQKVKK